MNTVLAVKLTTALESALRCNGYIEANREYLEQLVATAQEELAGALDEPSTPHNEILGRGVE